jgi:AcrR family transcriptional regulator
MGIEERRAREFVRREGEILKSALQLFRGDDWQNVTVEQIAQHAEIGKGTVYKHFASKDEIYARLALDFQRAVVERIRRLPGDLSPAERVRAVLRIGWEAHLTSPELHRVVLYCGQSEFRSSLTPATVATFDAFERERREMLRAVIEQGIERGQFRDGPAEELLFGVQAAFWGAVQILWSGYLGDIDRERYLEKLTSFILAALRYRPDADRGVPAASAHLSQSERPA